MKAYTDFQLKNFPWIVSAGTLKPESLLVSFWQIAEILAKWNDDTIPGDLLQRLEHLAGEDSREQDWDDDDATGCVEWLESLLQYWAPFGCRFGSHEGDGALFGFWLAPEWADFLDQMAYRDPAPELAAGIVRALLDSGFTDPEDASDRYFGIYRGTETEVGRELAQELAENSGVDVSGLQWPQRCIDWDAAWQELRMGGDFELVRLPGADWAAFTA